MSRKDKQLEERLLTKALSRSSSRGSSSQSAMIELASSVERASSRVSVSSVAESDSTNQELQQIVPDETTLKLVNQYVKRRFQYYLNNDIEDIDLWESIHYDFEDFIEQI
jgi:hypothetical protein